MEALLDTPVIATPIYPIGDIAVPAGATLEEFIYVICDHPRWHWAARWFRLGELIVSAPSIRTPAHTMSVDNSDERCPPDIDALGCRGIDIKGRLAWLFFDLDVGHGRPAVKYAATAGAIKAAHSIRDFFDGAAEIRLSKSGIGVHVAHQLPDDVRPGSEGPKLARAISDKLGIRCDRTVLGRQCRWLWCRNPTIDSFKLIEPIEEFTNAN